MGENSKRIRLAQRNRTHVLNGLLTPGGALTAGVGNQGVRVHEDDEADRPIRAHDQEGNQVYTWRDLDGRPRCSVDPNGNVIHYTYWDSTRNSLLKRVTQPAPGSCPGSAPTSGVRALEYDYDANGNVTSTTQIASDGSASRVSYTRYDERNRPLQVTGPTHSDASLGSIRPVTVTSYDFLGKPTRIQAGHCPSSSTGCAASAVLTTQATWLNDDFGRRIKETDPLGKAWNYAYDINHNLSQMTDAKGAVTTYAWDYGHRLKSRTQLSAGNVAITRNDLGLPLTETTSPCCACPPACSTPRA